MPLSAAGALADLPERCIRFSFAKRRKKARINSRNGNEAGGGTCLALVGNRLTLFTTA